VPRPRFFLTLPWYELLDKTLHAGIESRLMSIWSYNFYHLIPFYAARSDWQEEALCSQRVCLFVRPSVTKLVKTIFLKANEPTSVQIGTCSTQQRHERATLRVRWSKVKITRSSEEVYHSRQAWVEQLYLKFWHWISYHGSQGTPLCAGWRKWRKGQIFDK